MDVGRGLSSQNEIGRVSDILERVYQVGPEDEAMYIYIYICICILDSLLLLDCFLFEETIHTRYIRG